jgi:ABC-type transporter Mla subunit MlaD
VLGTFIGIFIGLWDFDTGNIEASVPTLLEGLKLAFITSIVGIGLSIWLKGSTLRKQKKQAASKKTYTRATVDDLAGFLQSIENSLTGAGNSTVLSQLQELGTTFSNKQDDLIRAFNEFATQMAENNTEALIEALENVMRDFNAKINEQFGDNFKQLNEAVGRINEWQEQYRQQMNELAEQFKVAAASIEKSRESLELIAERSDAIVLGAEKLNPILEALQHQTQQINDRLEAFKALADEARKAFPVITENLEMLTNDFSTAVKETIADSHKSMEEQKTALANQGKQLETMIGTTNGQLKKMTDDFSNTVEEMITNSHNSVEAQKTALANQSEQLKTTVTENSKLMKDQITELDKALEEQLQAALKSLGDNLASLSKKFVEDYTPLTEKLHEVLNMVDGLPEPSP